VIVAGFGRLHEEAMSAGEKQDMSEIDAALQKRLRLFGVSILAVGLFAAALVYWTAVPDDVNLYPNTKRYEYEMEVIGGKSNLLAAELREWFGSLWHGKRLARLLAFLSVGGSLACFFLAHRLNHPYRTGNRADGEGI
jgi:hypothetical protein